jgi:hypothetical protein
MKVARSLFTFNRAADERSFWHRARIDTFTAMGWAVRWTNAEERFGSVRAGTRDRVQSGACAGLWVLQSVSTGRGAAGAQGRTGLDWTRLSLGAFGVSRKSRVNHMASPSETTAELRSSDQCALYLDTSLPGASSIALA